MPTRTSPLEAAGEGSTDQLTVLVHRYADHAVLTVRGEIDLATGPRLRRAVHELLDAGHARLIIDLDRVEFIDCAGLGILLETHRRTRVRDGSMTLVCRGRFCTRLFAVSGLDKVFTFEETLAAARAN